MLVGLGHVRAGFAAVDDVDAVADAIGRIFDSLLVTSRGRRPRATTLAEDYERWGEGIDRLPSVIQYNTPLALCDPYNASRISIFHAS